MASNNWLEFWKNETESFFKVMRMSTFAFADRFTRKFNLQDSSVLDFGCGPGFLIDALSGTTDQITGIDINDYFINICKDRYPKNFFVVAPSSVEEQILVLKQHLADRQFDWIILLSISQYYPTKNEFYQTVKMLSSYLNKGGSILIADVISSRTSPLLDLFAVFKKSVYTGNVIHMIQFLRYLWLSDYRVISSKKPLLKFKAEDFMDWSCDLGLQCTPYTNLTLHPTRMSYCLKRIS